MIDNGRRYYSPGWIRREIREMAYLKLNQLHLHFSDNQGFRIASASHPEIVSARHLTKRQVRGIVGLARRLHIRVIPEIDMPGHLTAALAAHPELQLTDAAGERRADRLDFTLPAARRFARDLILEYLPLFGGRYWHAGADEYLAPADYAGYPQLERYARSRYGPRATGADAYLGFINWIDRLVRRHGRTLRVWHDGLSGGRAVRVRRDVVVEWWTDHAGPTPRELLASGHRILNAGWYPTYYVLGPIARVAAVGEGGLRVVAGRPLQRVHREHPGAHHPAPDRAHGHAAAARLRAACVERRSQLGERPGHRARHRAAPAAAGPEDLGLARPGGELRRLPAHLAGHRRSPPRPVGSAP